MVNIQAVIFRKDTYSKRKADAWLKEPNENKYEYRLIFSRIFSIT